MGDYTTEYTITNGECTDSVMLTVSLVADEQSDPSCNLVDAGTDNSMTITQSQAEAIESWDKVRKLYLSLLADGVARDGSFDPSIWDLIKRYQREDTGGPGEFSTVNTITEGICSDSVTLITVVPDEA